MSTLYINMHDCSYTHTESHSTFAPLAWLLCAITAVFCTPIFPNWHTNRPKQEIIHSLARTSHWYHVSDYRPMVHLYGLQSVSTCAQSYFRHAYACILSVHKWSTTCVLYIHETWPAALRLSCDATLEHLEQRVESRAFRIQPSVLVISLRKFSQRDRDSHVQ